MTDGTGSGLRVGTVLGAPVVVRPSWFLIALLVTFLYTPQVADALPGIGAAAVAVSLAYALLLLLSVFLHEVAHAAAARAVGTPPSLIALDLWGGHTVFSEEARSPGRSIFVAVVGPGTNAVLAAAAFAAQPAVATGGVTELLVRALAWANLFVAVFNALPGLPLDGGRVLEGIVWAVTRRREAGTLAAGWIGRGVAVALVLLTVVRPLLAGQQLSVTAAVWALLVAGLLWQGASQAIAVASWRRRAPRVSVRTLQRPAVAVPAGTSMAEARRAADGLGVVDVVLLDVYGRPAGVLDGQAAASVPAARAQEVPVAAVARTLHPEASVPQDLAGEALVEHLERAPHPEYAVLDPAGRVVGVLAWRDVAQSAAGR